MLLLVFVFIVACSAAASVYCSADISADFITDISASASIPPNAIVEGFNSTLFTGTLTLLFGMLDVLVLSVYDGTDEVAALATTVGGG